LPVVEIVISVLNGNGCALYHTKSQQTKLTPVNSLLHYTGLADLGELALGAWFKADYNINTHLVTCNWTFAEKQRTICPGYFNTLVYLNILQTLLISCCSK